MYLLELMLSIGAVTLSSAVPTHFKDSCKVPPRLEFAELEQDWEKETFSLGYVAHYTCRPGYILRGPKIKMICTEGNIWQQMSDSKCKKRPCGNPGEIDFGTFELKNEDGFVFGAIAEYTCDSGYQMISKHNTIECTATGWSKALPHCEARLCPPVVDDSLSVLSTVFDEEYTAGHVIKLQCKNPNNTLIGPSRIYCTSNGTWNIDPPTCKARLCPPVVDDSVRVLSTVPNEEYTADHVIKLECKNPNNKLNGPSQISCTSNGTWNIDPPTCKGTCTVQNDKMKQHNIQVKNPQMQHVAHSDVITFVCAPGYDISDPEKLIINCSEGVLMYPKCHLKGTCTIQRNKMRQHNINVIFPITVHVGYKEMITFVCAPGYEISDQRNLTVKCNQGRISYPTCHWREQKNRKKSCLPPPGILDGEYLEEKRLYYESGSIIHYKCISWYKLNGRQAIKCRNGLWESPPTCLEPCILNRMYMTGNNTIVVDESEKYFKHNKTVRFKCLPTFKISNPQLLKVQCLKGVLKYPTCVKAAENVQHSPKN